MPPPPVAPPLRTPTPAAAHTLLARTDLLALGRRWDGYAFIPAAAAALVHTPGDAQLRLLLASNLARLGLRTAALEHLDRLDPIFSAANPAAVGLRRTVLCLPPDELPAAQRLAATLTGLERLAARGVHWPEPIEHAMIEARTAAFRWFRTNSGNLVRRPADHADAPALSGTTPPEPPAWSRFVDDESAAKRIALPGGNPRAVCVEGLDPTPAARRLAALLPRQPEGWWPRISIVEDDLARFLDALSVLGGEPRDSLLDQSRCTWFLGPGAVGRFTEHLAARTAWVPEDALFTSPLVPDAASGNGTPVSRALQNDDAVRRARSAEVIADLRAAAHTPARRAERYRAALAGAAPPLRVLILTSRFSTFIQHSSADIARAFERALPGRVAGRVFMEPDDSTHPTPLAYGEECRRFRPDMVLSLNYTRLKFGGMIPADTPMVTWVQDAMPHLFDSRQGAAIGPLDVLVGHPHWEFFSRFNYPPERCIPFPVLASPEKFHPGPVPPHLAERCACDIAFVTNHSRTPDQVYADLLDRTDGCAQAGKAVRSLRTMVEAIVQSPLTSACIDRLGAAIEAFLGGQQTPEQRASFSTLINQVARPLADAYIRHRTLGWAAEAAREHNLRLHVYGRGWERHPTLSTFAKGPLQHGEELRAAYQCAAINLHASINLNLHQRVMECALSGGLPVSFLKYDDAELLGTQALAHAQAVAPNLPSRGEPLLHALADHPGLMAVAAQRQRLGLPVDATWNLDPNSARHTPTFWGGAEMHRDVAWLMGDLAETTFTSPESLAALAQRAKAEPAWRADLSQGIARRVKEHLTYDAAAVRILRAVATNLEVSAPGTKP